MSSLPSLESLPTELHTMILRSLIGHKSLSAAIEASAILHEVYDAYLDKDELWTQVTINQLLYRGVKLFPPAPVVEVCGYTARFDQNFYLTQNALSTLYSQFRQRKPLKLNPADRKALAKIGNMVKWNVIEGLTDDDVAKFTVERLNDPHKKFTACPPYWYSENRVGMYESWQYCFTGQSFSRTEYYQILDLIQQEWVRQRDKVQALEQQRRALRIAQLAEQEGRRVVRSMVRGGQRRGDEELRL